MADHYLFEGNLRADKKITADALVKGIAYHGNRMLTHIQEDMKDLAASGFNSVVHMYSHNDWERHKNTMKDIFNISSYYGLDVWVDNWGLAGRPGEKSHFTTYFPDAHQVYSDGKMHPYCVCFNDERFVDFTKHWIDTVCEAGAKKIFWDEPHLESTEETDPKASPINWTCRCPRCQKLFEERYNKPMPSIQTPEVEEFRRRTITDYFRTVTEYAKAQGMYNSLCVFFTGARLGVDLDELCSLPALDNVGSDPYWLGDPNAVGYEAVYRKVYGSSRRNIELCEKYQKEHNLWIQTYSNPTGREEEIIAAADAIYDAGARSIFAWGYRGSDACDYRASTPERTWYATKAAFERITERFRDEQRRAVREAMELD